MTIKNLLKDATREMPVMSLLTYRDYLRDVSAESSVYAFSCAKVFLTSADDAAAKAQAQAHAQPETP